MADLLEILQRYLADPSDEKVQREFHEILDRKIQVLVASTLGVAGKADRQAVEEYTQQIWLKLLLRNAAVLRQFRGETDTSFFAYLNVVIHHHIFDHPLDPVRFQDTIERLRNHDDGTRPADREVERKRVRERMREAIHRRWPDPGLASRNHLIAQLHFLDEVSARRIAGIRSLGLTQAGVESVIAVVKAILRDSLSDGGAAR